MLVPTVHKSIFDKILIQRVVSGQQAHPAGLQFQALSPLVRNLKGSVDGLTPEEPGLTPSQLDQNGVEGITRETFLRSEGVGETRQISRSYGLSPHSPRQ